MKDFGQWFNEITEKEYYQPEDDSQQEDYSNYNPGMTDVDETE